MIGAKKLFNEMNRDFTGPKSYTESIFDYLNRSARLESKRIRNLLEQWIEGLSSEVQDELRARIRSRDDRQHLGAFYELYLHELLSKSGFSVDFHPAVNNKKTHPDFRVLKDGKPLFYLEATLAALSDKDTSAKAREKQVYDAINRMKSPNFFIGVKVHGAPTTNPPGAKMRSFLENKLSNLDPDVVTKQLEQGDSETLPSWNWRHNDWQITFSPIPKKPEARGKHGVRPIGLQIQDARWATPHIRIRESIRDKATKYGELDLPYIVAINVTDELGVDETDISNALFGEEQITIIFRGNNVIGQKPNRKPNGAWYGPSGLRNRRVSAVLIADNLSPWSIAKVTPILWHNPWTNRPLTLDTLLLPQLFSGENNQLEKRKGKNGRELLGLDPNWPRTY